jgi:hypothetical protein
VRKNTGKARVFTMGVGEDLDTHLVDLVAGRHGGTSHYVRPGEDVKTAISALYEHIAYPVLTDVTLTITGGDVKAYGVLPKEMPDLFRGQQLLVAGRYRGHGKTKVRLEGKLGKETRRFEINVDFPEEEKEQDFVASVWGHRQVGYLLDQIRLSGETPALREEVIQLAKQYGIVTPYTSWLVQGHVSRREPDGLGWELLDHGQIGRQVERVEATQPLALGQVAGPPDQRLRDVHGQDAWPVRIQSGLRLPVFRRRQAALSSSASKGSPGLRIGHSRSGDELRAVNLGVDRRRSRLLDVQLKQTAGVELQDQPRSSITATETRP